jgi:hypothetical protein
MLRALVVISTLIWACGTCEANLAYNASNIDDLPLAMWQTCTTASCAGRVNDFTIVNDSTMVIASTMVIDTGNTDHTLRNNHLGAGDMTNSPDHFTPRVSLQTDSGGPPVFTLFVHNTQCNEQGSGEWRVWSPGWTSTSTVCSPFASDPFTNLLFTFGRPDAPHVYYSGLSADGVFTSLDKTEGAKTLPPPEEFLTSIQMESQMETNAAQDGHPGEVDDMNADETSAPEDNSAPEPASVILMAAGLSVSLLLRNSRRPA